MNDMSKDEFNRVIDSYIKSLEGLDDLRGKWSLSEIMDCYVAYLKKGTLSLPDGVGDEMKRPFRVLYAAFRHLYDSSTGRIRRIDCDIWPGLDRLGGFVNADELFLFATGTYNEVRGRTYPLEH